MRAAFKEWAVVVDALGLGEQVLILRKGGISEGQGGFKPEHPEFLLFPTLFHQQREQVIPSAQARYDQLAISFPPEDLLRLEYFAHVARVQKLESASALPNLRGHHIWQDRVLDERFEWSKLKHIYCLFVRVYKLSRPVELPMLPEYGGCKSWVMLNQDISTADAHPALDDSEFARRLEQIQFSLQEPRAAA